MQKSAANPARVRRDALPRGPYAASCQALFLCGSRICSLRFPGKWSAYEQFLLDIRAFSNSAFLSDICIFSHLYVVPNSRTYTDFSICWDSLLLLFSDCALIEPPEKPFCSLA